MLHKLKIVICTMFFGLSVLPTIVLARIDFDPDDLERWADATFEKALDEHRFSGLVVTLVQDGEVKLLKGFGYDDYELKTPIDPRTARFHLASNTKPFTATAIAQLADRHLIDSLDDPANKYLKRFQIKSAFGKEVTLWHLLNHRAGFEDYLVHVGNVAHEIVTPVSSDVVISLMPEIVREPGTLSVYSNFSTAVLGAVVEDVTGMKLADYMKQEIFEPLGMSNTELRYSIERADGLGVPYAFFPNGEAQKILHIPFHPFFAAAGGMISTAPDMAVFMEAHLNAGLTDKNPILSSKMFDVMHSVHSRNHPETSGIGMTYSVGSYAGYPTFGHGGGWPGWYSVTLMLPESNAGYFAAVMSDSAVPTFLEKVFGSDRMRSSSSIIVGPGFKIEDLTASFTAKFLGPERTVDKFVAVPNINDLAGFYWREKRSHTRMDAFFELMDNKSSVIRVVTDGPNSLRINGRGPYKALTPDTFGLAVSSTESQSDTPIALAETITFSDKFEDGTRRLLPSGGLFAYSRTGAIRNPEVMRYLLVIAALVGLTGVFALLWPNAKGPFKASKWFAVSLAVIIMLSMIVLYGGFAEGDYWRLYKLSGRTPRFIMLAILGNLAVVVAIGSVVSTILGWRQCLIGSPPGNPWKVHASLLALAAIALVVVLEFVNMVGLHLPA